MKNPVVRIKMHIRRSDGTYRYVDPVVSGNAKLKPLYALVNGKPEHHPEGVYNLRYLGRNGKRVWQAVGQDAGLAMIERIRKESELKARLSGVIVEDSQPESKGITLADSIAGYLSDMDDLNKKKRTLLAYGLALRYFTQSCGKKYLSEVEHSDLITYMKFLRKRGYEERTVSNLLINVQTFLKRQGIRIPIKREEWPQPTTKVVVAYTDKQIDDLMNVLDQEKRDIFAYFLCTGMREQEVMYSLWSDVNLDEREIEVKEKLDLGFTLKTGTEGVVPVPDMLIEMLRARRERQKLNPSEQTTRLRELIFPAVRGGAQGHFLRILKTAAFKAGLNCGGCVNKKKACCADGPTCTKWKLHKFRKSFATKHSRGGTPVNDIRQMLHHKDLATTLIYLEGTKYKTAETRTRVNKAFA